MELIVAKSSDKPIFMQRLMEDGERKTGPRKFTRNYSLGRFPEKIQLSINKDVKVINGAYGDKPTQSDIWAQAELLEDKWGARDGGLSKFDYDGKLELRYKTFHTPAFSACVRGRPCAVILPVQVDAIPATSKQLADEKAWDKDDPGGKKLMVRKLVSEAPGLAEMVIEAYIAYARILRRAGIIDEVVGFTRPKNISVWLSGNPAMKTRPKEEIFQEYYLKTGDRNIRLHLEMGARMELVYPDGCPNDGLAMGIMVRMNYTHLLD
jgi:hypothetical protein